jgi:hypothetical protein
LVNNSLGNCARGSMRLHRNIHHRAKMNIWD